MLVQVADDTILTLVDVKYGGVHCGLNFIIFNYVLIIVGAKQIIVANEIERHRILCSLVNPHCILVHLLSHCVLIVVELARHALVHSSSLGVLCSKYSVCMYQSSKQH